MPQLWRGAPGHDLPGYRPTTDTTTGLVPGPQAPTRGSCAPLLTGRAGGPRRVEAPLDRGEGNRLEPRLDACSPMVPTHLPLGAEVHSPLPWHEWDRSLATHPNQRFQCYITEGLWYGFRVGYDYHHRCQPARRNMASALEQPQVIRVYLDVECNEGRVLGPLDPLLLPQVHVSQFGVIPKGNTGKWRLIVDMS